MGGGGARAVAPVRWQRPMDEGTGTHLLLRQLSPLYFVPLFIGGGVQRNRMWDGMGGRN